METILNTQLETGLSHGLDFYKPTMSQLEYEKYPDAEVTFTFHNRGEQRLGDYIDPLVLQARLDAIRAKGWSQPEIEFLGGLKDGSGLPLFNQEYLNFIKTNELPAV